MGFEISVRAYADLRSSLIISWNIHNPLRQTGLPFEIGGLPANVPQAASQHLYVAESIVCQKIPLIPSGCHNSACMSFMEKG
ncbi:hypothetical protein [Spirosoma profusum]|uniref:hypothetical protein n=1 Tax=Spirosoma profusum TaxID=2771354 RepID=UPI00168A2CF9|nr:hypothetical protein [Spirosoma profusum]